MAKPNDKGIRELLLVINTRCGLDVSMTTDTHYSPIINNMRNKYVVNIWDDKKPTGRKKKNAPIKKIGVTKVSFSSKLKLFLYLVSIIQQCDLNNITSNSSSNSSLSTYSPLNSTKLVSSNKGMGTSEAST